MPLCPQGAIGALDIMTGNAYTAPTTWYIGLCNANPNGVLTPVEPVGNNYSRTVLTGTPKWHTYPSDSNYVSNTTSLTLPVPSGTGWGIINYVLLYTASSGGNPLFYWPYYFIANGSSPAMNLGVDALAIKMSPFLNDYLAQAFTQHFFGLSTWTRPSYYLGLRSYFSGNFYEGTSGFSSSVLDPDYARINITNAFGAATFDADNGMTSASNTTDISFAASSTYDWAEDATPELWDTGYGANSTPHPPPGTHKLLRQFTEYHRYSLWGRQSTFEAGTLHITFW